MSTSLKFQLNHFDTIKEYDKHRFIYCDENPHLHVEVSRRSANCRKGAHVPEQEVEVEWDGPTERLGPVVTLVKHAPASLKWYLEARAQELSAKFEFRFEGDAEQLQ